MADKFNTLILGASYGSLLGCKLAMAGHPVTLVCTAPTAEVINSAGTTVRFPVRGMDELVVVNSHTLAGKTAATTPEQVNVNDFDLIVLGMQEPQYNNPAVAALMKKIADAEIPCMAIMNMPPLPYIQRLPGIDTSLITNCYASPSVWAHFNPEVVTLASPDPQAFRPPDAEKNVLQVSLPTNFKVARFGSDKHTAMLQTIESDILAARFPTDSGDTELPVKVKLHESLYVPLAKWSMLMAGNFRCIKKDGMIAISDAVHGDIEQSKAVYEWTKDLCVKLGADRGDLVPFEKYANAAKGLSQPSSAAKALDRGVASIERVEKLVMQLAAQLEMSHPEIDTIVENVEWYVAKNSESELLAKKA